MISERYRRVHIAADRRAPFAIVRASGPARAPRGAPGLIERVLSWVFGS
ncbi:hypothetical protein [Sphingomonas sp. BE137]|nr:hypothetical protein [Sphingomonas sp. BE137]MDR6850156.1 hypothetical protein [Sphingomonas sp. BE137]